MQQTVPLIPALFPDHSLSNVPRPRYWQAFWGLYHKLCVLHYQDYRGDDRGRRIEFAILSTLERIDSCTWQGNQ